MPVAPLHRNMRRLWLLALLLVGCVGPRPWSAMSFAVTPPVAPTYLRYHVFSTRGEWTRELVVGKDMFAELRESGGRAYTLGLLGDRAWMRVGSRAPVEIDGDLAADERAEAGWLGLRFAEPGAGGKTERESCNAKVCTFVYTPHDGHALWVDVDRDTRHPTAFSWIASTGGIESCDSLTWTEIEGTLAVSSATGGAIVDEVGRETMSWTLDEGHAEATPPEWARVGPDEVVPLRQREQPSLFSIADPSSRVYVPVEAGGSEPLALVLDTGSPVTVLSRRALGALGVVPSPDPAMHVKPPFIPEDSYDPAIVDRLVIGGIELHGVGVLVPRHDSPFDGDEAGLLGMDILSRYVVDVDSPASTLRIWPRDRFHADVDFTDLAIHGGPTHVVVAGAIEEIGSLPLILDTGAPVNLVVGGPLMHALHPHRHGDGQDLRPREDDDRSYYEADIDGFSLGPFPLPGMEVTGHDRRPDLPFLDDDSALVGLGVMRHFRMVFDARRRVVHVAPGPSYVVLATLGLEVDDRDGAPTITRLAGDERGLGGHVSPSWNRPLREGDVVRSVSGKRVTRREDALVALATAAQRGTVRLVVERQGNLLKRVLSPRR
jgi:hypothetical protein